MQNLRLRSIDKNQRKSPFRPPFVIQSRTPQAYL